MSSDGAIDKPRSARPARGEDRGVAGIALAVLLVLALIATIVMVFSDNPVWMRIGTLAALWAAFIGAFLVARYRRQAASEAARVRDLHTVYELQLEREISARREHELVVEKDLRDSIRAETSDSIHALRHEIAALREQLGQLGVTLPEDRFAVGGHASAGELGAGSTLPSVPSERVAPRRRASESSERAGSATGAAAASSAASGVSREATPSTERTEKLSPVAAEKERAGETSRGRRRPAVRPVTRPQPAVDFSEPPTATMPAATDSAGQAEPTQPERQRTEQKPAETQHAEEQSAEQQRTERQPAEQQRTERQPVAPEQPAPKSRHGESGGLSVADLMARLGGDDAPSGGRRRRHSED